MRMSSKTLVIYNAACPVCSAEIGHYEREARACGLPMEFEDLHTADLGALGLTEDRALRRLHVVQDGRLLAGVDGFIAIWATMPRWRWLARLVSLPGIRGVAGAGYDYVAAPLVYRWYRRRVLASRGRAR